MIKKCLTSFIFARGGSKGIKNKNIKMVGGSPLIEHSIRCAFESKYIDKVVVSTDSESIAKVAQTCGADILMRPAELADDQSPEILSWKHAIANTSAFISNSQTTFISLPATSPLRASGDVDLAIEKFLKNNCEIVFGICKSHRNPYLNMVTIDQDNFLKIVISSSNAARRQDVPEVFDITTCVYVSSAKYILESQKLMAGRVGYVEIPVERSIDIDDEFDLYLADLMIKSPFKRAE